jgi:opine dehydrogenase
MATQADEADSSDAELPDVAVLGAGSQGHAFAGFLGLQGCDVSIVGRSGDKVSEIRSAGGIEVEGHTSGFAEIDPEAATTSVADGIEGRDVIFLVVPAYGHEYFARELVDAVEDGQQIVVGTDNFGSLRMRHIFEEAGVTADVTIAGASISPFPGRSHEPASVDIHGVKANVPLAAVPSSETAAVVETINPAFDPEVQFNPARDVFEVNLTNLNVPMHTTIALFNLTHIDRGDEWRFYGDGLTPAVERLITSLDDERLALGAGLDLDIPSLPALVDDMYEVCTGDTIMELLGESPIHKSGLGPTDLEFRYLTEDVPYGLVPMASICDELGIDCPTIDAMVHLLSVGAGTDFEAEGVTTEELGLSGLSSEEMQALVTGESS